MSKHYKAKQWANHERESAQARALEEKGEYLLPAIFDDTEIPGILSTTAYIDLRQLRPEDFGALILEKLGVNLDIQAMLHEMREYLPQYVVEVDGESVVFDSEQEAFRAEYPVSILLHMYREGWLDAMFLDTSILVY